MIKDFVLHHFPLAAKKFVELKHVLRNRSLNPQKIDLNNGLKLFADWNEPRGRALILSKANGQPHIKRFWKKSIQLYKPDLALDIGANYGEIIFGITYPIETKLIIGVEANPSLIKFLNKSLTSHPDRQRMEIINKLAGESEDMIMEFYIDKKSSGRSTALKNNFVLESSTVHVFSMRLDSFVQSKLSPTTIVYKIDVEGFESFVLRGMEKLFVSEIDLIGCIEFNLEALAKNEINADEYLYKISQENIICILHNDGKLSRLTHPSIATIRQHLVSEKVETDLVLFSKEALYDKYIS